MDRDELAFYLALEQCPGIGPVNFRKIVESAGFTPSRASIALLQKANPSLLNSNQLNHLKNPDQESIERALEWLNSSSEHHILTIKDPEYPDLLKEVRDAPSILYAIGNTDLLNSPQIAIIGSRNCTPGGANTARDFSAYLARAGLTITSGMALGIDQQAHQGALDASGNTIAVIGTGIDRIYPSKNRQLAYQIAQKGLLLSEFPLGTPPNSENFPRRNRVISGLSVATLVVEATRKSGSLITAHYGLEQGREVFAIPGSIHNPQAKGCHHLIRQGAKLVDQASDIIDDIGSLLGFMAQQPVNDPTTEAVEMDTDYHKLLETIGYDPVSFESLVQHSGLTIEQLSSMLLILELNDHIQTVAGGKYVRC
ncbi:MAG: DNA-protecting protein DprA [Gammaproteobacteria bacterium]|nr:DNA-protecting protein DprA [Gammaproteobacteria bacterium]MBL6999374.1 DNA-protecting protein DprA [Gammaproteobacteria bacterium]